jgi:hypothetical protein
MESHLRSQPGRKKHARAPTVSRIRGVRVFPLQHSSSIAFYRSAVDLLNEASIPFLVGGAFAMRTYTEVERDTKDFDLMMRPEDVDRALALFREKGFRADYAFSHWLAKVHRGEYFIDIVFRGGNGLAEVEDSWFENASEATIIDRELKICPVEEMIWQKAYIMERERYDGADILHLLRSCAREVNWERLVARFGPDWRVLLSHLILFGFVYPGEARAVPAPMMEDLLERLKAEAQGAPEASDLCRGTLLSRAQYLADVERLNYRDVRHEDERVKMTFADVQDWTNAIDREQRPH